MATAAVERLGRILEVRVAPHYDGERPGELWEKLREEIFDLCREIRIDQHKKCLHLHGTRPL
jgi:hypothetical protein